VEQEHFFRIILHPLEEVDLLLKEILMGDLVEEEHYFRKILHPFEEVDHLLEDHLHEEVLLGIHDLCFEFIAFKVGFTASSVGFTASSVESSKTALLATHFSSKIAHD
jgi:hypothetical protein